MARPSLRLAENQPGPFFVDETCIDCDTCRQLAPETFARSPTRQMSFVARQPGAADERRRARLAVIACPTASIGTADKTGLTEAAHAFPLALDDADDADDRDGAADRAGDHSGADNSDAAVHYCGYASEDSFGAASYFIRRPAGNVLVDSPRAARPLLDNLVAAGGVALMFLSHRDDVADHALFARRFGCRRILHADDVDAGTRAVELPWSGAEPVPLAPDLLLIPVPGHTRGSAVLLYAGHILFTGDHLWLSEDDPGALEASRSVCWYSWREQTRSMERLLAFDFDWILPGHGRRTRAPSPAIMRGKLEALVARMKRR